MRNQSLGRTSLRVLLLLCGLSLQLSCESKTPPPQVATCNASVTFHANDLVRWPEGEIVRIALAVSKLGKTPLVNGKGGPGEQYGWHNFPTDKPADITAYYEMILQNAGWKARKDFVRSGGTLHFYGISRIGAGSNHPRVEVYGTTHPQVVHFEQLEVFRD